jgi:hypothetical protein
MSHYCCEYCGKSFREGCKCDTPNEEYQEYFTKKNDFMNRGRYINYKKVDEQLEELFIALYGEPPEKTYPYR